MGEIVKLRPQQELIHKIIEAWKRADNHDGGAKTARIEAGSMLLELREQIEAEHPGLWWEWYAQHLPRSRRDAEFCMSLARAENPQAAYETALQRQRLANARHAEKRKEQSNQSSAFANAEPGPRPRPKFPKPTEWKQPIQQELIDQAIVLVKQMNIPTKARFARLFEATF